MRLGRRSAGLALRWRHRKGSPGLESLRRCCPRSPAAARLLTADCPATHGHHPATATTITTTTIQVPTTPSSPQRVCRGLGQRAVLHRLPLRLHGHLARRRQHRPQDRRLRLQAAVPGARPRRPLLLGSGRRCALSPPAHAHHLHASVHYTSVHRTSPSHLARPPGRRRHHRSSSVRRASASRMGPPTPAQSTATAAWTASQTCRRSAGKPDGAAASAAAAGHVSWVAWAARGSHLQGGLLGCSTGMQPAGRPARLTCLPSPAPPMLHVHIAPAALPAGASSAQTRAACPAGTRTPARPAGRAGCWSTTTAASGCCRRSRWGAWQRLRRSLQQAARTALHSFSLFVFCLH